MRHLRHHRRFNRTSEHRWALRRNVAQNLFEHGEIVTTLPKAKDLRAFCEQLITLAVRVRKLRSSDPQGSLLARRRIHRLLGERSLVAKEHAGSYRDMSDADRRQTMRMASGRRHRTGEPRGKLVFTGESISYRLIEKVARRYEERPGGYTRVVRLPSWRIGDGASKAVLQLVGDEESPGTVSKPAKSARRRRSDARYALAVKVAKSGGAKASGASG